jgi:SAM-dependent methyltransferase
MQEPKQHDEQTALWNGSAGRAWVEGQELMDRILQPFEDLLVDAIAEAPCASVLDVGCGTGSTTLALARRLGNAVGCMGVDISEPMLQVAERRARELSTPPTFILADAQRYVFEPDSFDAIASRFGVMFFDDPPRAFANLRRASRAGARLRLLAWRTAAENPFMTTAERVAAPLLPHVPPRLPDQPGQFAFGDGDRVRRILREGGWSELELAPLDVRCRIPEPDLMRYVTRFGPVGRVLQDASPDLQARVIEKLQEGFAGYIEGGEVRFNAACWMIRATA